jgi:hypothetical protein
MNPKKFLQADSYAKPITQTQFYMKTTSIFAAAAGCLLLLSSCGGSATKETAADTAVTVDNEAFYATQPVACGQYRAVSYDITGEKARKGKFDGRILAAIAPAASGDPSALYVFENGNRTKINYKVILKAPFEKNDSGVYQTVDTNDLPVTITTDSTVYTLSFQRKEEKINIGFESNPMNTGTYIEMIERINNTSKK